MGKAPMLLVDVYDQEGEIISSNRPSYLRKQENERVAKLAVKEVKKDDILNSRKSNKKDKSEMEAPQEEKEAVING